MISDAVLISLFSGTTISSIAGMVIGYLNKGHIKETKKETQEVKAETREVKAETQVIRTQTDGNYTRLEAKLAVTEKEVTLLKDQVIILNRLVSKNDLDIANRARDTSETAALEVYQELVETKARLAAIEARQQANNPGGNPT